MRIHVQAEALRGPLALASTIATTRGAVPILACVLLTAEEGKGLSLTAFDGDMFLTVGIEAKVDLAGALAIPAQQLSNLVAKWPKGLATIEAQADGQARAQLGRSKAALRCMPAVEFPPSPLKVSAVGSKLDPALLLGALGQVAHACAREDKAVISGLALVPGQGGLEFAGANGYQLATLITEVDIGLSEALLLPARVRTALAKLLAGHHEPIEVAAEEGRARFTVGATTLICRTLEGKFPPYRQIMPTEFAWSCAFEREEVLGALERALLQANENDAHVTSLSWGEGGLNIAARGETGEAHELVEAALEGDAPAKLSLNGRYLVNSLRAMPHPRVEMRGGDARKPVVLREAGSGEGFAGLSQVIMPIIR